MDTSSVMSFDSARPVIDGPNQAAAALGGEDFFKLLITQLTNQDPLEPTSNQELLNQIASIREIELSSTLTDSLESLTAQQRFASASGLIGQYVTGGTGPDGNPRSGVVTAVRFDATGLATLELATGERIPLTEVEMVMGGERAAESLYGRYVLAWDRSDPQQRELVEGLVTGVGMDEAGEVMLELDTGVRVALKDVLEWRAASDVEDVSGMAG
jgi:flagellar basal-body rod modification protein FlgD